MLRSNTVNVGGVVFDNVTMSEALALVEKEIAKGSDRVGSFLCVANQDIINRIRTMPELTTDLVNQAFLTIPDGYSIVYAAKYLKTPLKERVTGPDLMDKFIGISSEKGYKHFFLGAGAGIAQKMADNFLKKYPQLQISGIYSPPYMKKFSDEENSKMIKLINDAQPDVLWVSFGCPKQEQWIIENKGKLKVPVVAGVGAAFDFFSGNLKRAPKFVRDLRLEWFYRLCQEPSRLWRRYFLGGIQFMKIIMAQKLKKIDF